MSATTSKSEMWQARISHELAAELDKDAELLGLDGRSEIVREALRRLHQDAAAERMARSVEEFYDGQIPPLPVGVRSAAEMRALRKGKQSAPRSTAR